MLEAPACPPRRLRTVRRLALKETTPLRVPRLLPSVLDYRFTGDPWIHDWKDGHFTVNLGNFRVSHIQGVSFDWPAFNGLLDRVRQRCHRRRR